MKKTKQKIGIIMIILLLLSYLTPFINVSNAFNVSNAYIYSVKDSEYHLQYWNSNRNVWSYQIITYVGYKGEDGNFYPAYCLDSDKNGVGEAGPYTVTVAEAIQNQEVWRVLYNGFPYKTPEELGVANDYDAFCATKQAIYSVIYGYDPVTRYRGGDERGTQIANAIVKMVNIARTTSDNYTSPQVSINEVGNLKKEGEYYTQTYKVSSNVPWKDYNVYQISGLPSGSYFADVKGAKKTNFSSGENFKVYIPQKSIKSNVTSYIGVNGNCKTYPVLYGKAPNSSLQDYALVLSPFENGSANKKLNISPTGKVTIEKTSTANNIWNGVISGSLISNAKYKLYNSNRKLVGTYTTNNEGKIFISNLPLGTYYVQETTPTPQYTTLNDQMYSFTLDYIDDSEILKVTNAPVFGGYFSAIKRSNGNNIWTGTPEGQHLVGAKFGIYDLKGNIVRSYETGKELISISDENGVIFNNEKLQLGEYYLQEIEAPEHYELDSTKHYFKITENEQKINLELDNTPEIGNNLKITKVASDKNYITGTEKKQAVGEAKYEVRTGFSAETEVTMDNFSTGELVDTLITDKEGNTKTIIVGKGTYYIKEVSAPKGWKLDEKIYKIDVISNGETHKLELEDEPTPQGFLNINKTSLQKNYWTGEEAGTPLEGVRFELRDEENNVLLELVTDKNGQFSKDIQLDVGKYYLWEVEAPKHYILNDVPHLLEIAENGQKVTIDIKNEVETAGFVDVSKVASKDNKITGEEKGTYLPSARYKIENVDTGELVAELDTTDDGYLEEKIILGAGDYKIYEVESPTYYLKDSSIYYFKIDENGQELCFDFKDNPAEVKVNVEKSGVVEAQPNDEIRYDFDAVESLSNVPLDNFTFIDDLPYEKVKLTKLFTGIYTHKVKFNVYYKTNILDKWILIKENLDSTINNFLDFSKIKLSQNEVITNFKMEFGTVPEYFKATTAPYIFTTVNSNVEANDVWTNNVHLSGTYFDTEVNDDSEWTTKSHKEEPEVKKLPQTGM